MQEPKKAWLLIRIPNLLIKDPRGLVIFMYTTACVIRARVSWHQTNGRLYVQGRFTLAEPRHVQYAGKASIVQNMLRSLWATGMRLAILA